MVHLLLEDVQSWYEHITKTGIAEKYNVEVSAVTEQPWGMLDFVLHDPSGVLWRIAQKSKPKSFRARVIHIQLHT